MMINQWTCGGCGGNQWALEFEDEYPQIIIMRCTQCKYVDTMYVEDDSP